MFVWVFQFNFQFFKEVKYSKDHGKFFHCEVIKIINLLIRSKVLKGSWKVFSLRGYKNNKFTH